MKQERAGKFLAFLKEDPRTNDVDLSTGRPVEERRLFLDGGIGQPITLHKGDNAQTPVFPTLPQNLESNYGWADKWPCSTAKELLNEPVAQGDDQQTCLVELNTEDRYMYAVAVIPLPPVSEYPDPAAASFLEANKPVAPLPADASTPVATDPTKPFGNNPLQPGVHINAAMDEAAVVAVMKKLHDKYQVNTRDPADAKRQRNTCLKNGRARNWTDIQGHFYCIMPYSPHRECYSTYLAAEIERRLAGVTEPQKRLAGTVQIMWESYDKCFAPGKPYALDVETAKVFKYVMFSVQGAMDFNIDSEQRAISEFYSQTGQTVRPRRLKDTEPWLMEQGRYNDLRKTQMQAIIGRNMQIGCARTGGTWDPAGRTCNCGAGRTFDTQTFQCR
jgi:hypothetical protein